MSLAAQAGLLLNTRGENHMEDSMELVVSRDFNGIRLNCYQTAGQEDPSDFWATREQIGQALEYAEPMKAIAKIHERNKNRLDRFSTIVKLTTVEGGRRVTREVMVYNFKGLLEICRYSNQDNANAVIDVLWDIADEIRRTGSYSVKPDAGEFELRRKDLDLRGAQILQSLVDGGKFPMTPETRTVFAHEVFKLVTGHEYLSMLPASTEKYYSAGEIGEIVGLSAHKVGRIAKAHGLKAPEGESNEYGRWIFTKSPYCNREVPSFIYNEAALEWFKENQE